MKYDYDKMRSWRKKRIELVKQKLVEQDYKKKKKLEFEIKILDIKMAMERLKQ